MYIMGQKSHYVLSNPQIMDLKMSVDSFPKYIKLTTKYELKSNGNFMIIW